MFDFGFTRFTHSWISALWILSVIAAVLVVLSIWYDGCHIGMTVGLTPGPVPLVKHFLLPPIAAVLGLLFTRIILSRIDRDIRDQNEKK